jgi:hypothetical protein
MNDSRQEPENETYYVRRKGKIEGPWSADKLRSEIRLRKLSKYHELSNDKQNWVRAEKHQWLFPKKVRVAAQDEGRKDQSRENEEAPDKNSDSTGVEWFLAIDGEQVGPLSEQEVIGKIRSHNLSFQDTVWRDGFEEWTELGNLVIFEQYLDVHVDDAGMTAATVMIDRNASAAPPKNSIYAVASLVCALLGLVACPFAFFLGPIAIILAGIGYFDVSKNLSTKKGKNLAIAGGLVGLLSIVVFVVLVVIGAFASLQS